MTTLTKYQETLHDILEACHIRFSDIKPSDWVEKHRIMSSAESNFQGQRPVFPDKISQNKNSHSDEKPEANMGNIDGSLLWVKNLFPGEPKKYCKADEGGNHH